MSGKNTSVFGIYPTHHSADAAVEKLRAKGFLNTDVSVLYPQNTRSTAFGRQKATKSAEGTVAGAGSGVVIGGALGCLAGLGMLAFPGVGSLVAAGPIVATLAGMGGGGTIGGMIGAFIGSGRPEPRAKHGDGRVRKGGILLSVHTDDQEWANKGERILEQTGAEDIASTGESTGSLAPARL